jgi:hypothetical protein
MKYAVSYTSQLRDGSGGITYLEQGSFFKEVPPFLPILYDTREAAEAAIAEAKAYVAAPRGESKRWSTHYEFLYDTREAAEVAIAKAAIAKAKAYVAKAKAYVAGGSGESKLWSIHYEYQIVECPNDLPPAKLVTRALEPIAK